MTSVLRCLVCSRGGQLRLFYSDHTKMKQIARAHKTHDNPKKARDLNAPPAQIVGDR